MNYIDNWLFKWVIQREQTIDDIAHNIFTLACKWMNLQMLQRWLYLNPGWLQNPAWIIIIGILFISQRHHDGENLILAVMKDTDLHKLHCQGSHNQPVPTLLALLPMVSSLGWQRQPGIRRWIRINSASHMIMQGLKYIGQSWKVHFFPRCWWLRNLWIQFKSEGSRSSWEF